MSWIATTTTTSPPHLFPGLGTRALCGASRTVDRPGHAARPDEERPGCTRCVAIVLGRRDYWAGRRATWPA